MRRASDRPAGREYVAFAKMFPAVVDAPFGIPHIDYNEINRVIKMANERGETR